MENVMKDTIIAELKARVDELTKENEWLNTRYKEQSYEALVDRKEAFMKRCEALEADVRELEEIIEALGKEKAWLLNNRMEASEKISELERAARPRRTDGAKAIMVIRTESFEGRGTEDDPCRCVTQYWDSDGGLLAEHDPLADCKTFDAGVRTPKEIAESLRKASKGLTGELT